MGDEKNTVTAGPWHWVNDDTDGALEPDALTGSLRTVEQFGENKTEVIDGKRYTSFRLPKFILEAEFSARSDEENLANRGFILAAVNACFSVNSANPQAVAEGIEDMIAAVEGLLMEFDKFSQYGSPIAKKANERVTFARALLSRIGRSTG